MGRCCGLAVCLALGLAASIGTTDALRIPGTRSSIRQPSQQGFVLGRLREAGHEEDLTPNPRHEQPDHSYQLSDTEKPDEQYLYHQAWAAPTVSHGSDEVPGIELAARQALFNYGTQQGISILQSRVQDLAIPDAEKSFNLPLVGEFKLQLSNLHVTQFNASSDEARFTIMDGRFQLCMTQVEAQLTFNWHWEKLGMSGTGTGELDLSGGSIDYRFHVVTSEASKPHIQVEEVGSRFSSVSLQIRSFSADWLYQAVMSLFNDQIQKAVQTGIADALQHEVPDRLNQVLDTLPTRLDIKGLPFSTSFEYSIFTLTYVLVKGYGQVEADSEAAMLAAAAAADAAAATTASAATTAADATDDAAAVAATAGAAGGSSSSSRRQQLQDVVSACPFTATPMPLDSEAIAADGHMTSIYLHESVINCMLWGLFRSNALQITVQEGTIPKLHITTDLLAMLIPQLPKAYPHQFLRIEAAALAMPQVSFSASEGTTIQASYRTSIFVVNETAGNPKIATLSANVTVTGQVNFDSTIITSAVVRHAVEDSAMPVSAAQWDNTVAWFIQNYAGLFPLQALIHNFVHTPVTSLVGLVNAESTTYEGWFTISGDVQLHPNGRRMLLGR